MIRKLKRLLPKALRSDAKTIPVVRLHGTIMADSGGLRRSSLNLASVSEVLQTAFDKKDAPAVAISINSPGGSPVQSRLIYKRIKDLAKEKDKKVFMFVEDVAASGGYMIAAAGDEIYADPSSIVGSIGVIFSGFGFQELIAKIGVERRVHTAGKNKSILDSFLPENPDDIERLKEAQLEIHEVFINLVKESRGDKLADNDDLFTGQFWTGGTGVKLGLVDALGDMRSVMKEKYGEKTKFEVIETSRGFLGLKGMFGSSSADPAMIAGSAAKGLSETLNEQGLWSRYGL